MVFMYINMFMKTINLGLIDLDIHEGKLGVSVSGGADSAILLYLVMKYADPESMIHVISCANKEKHNLNPRYALNVLEFCMELTGNRKVKQHTYFVERQTRETWGGGMLEFLQDNTVDMMYTGFTSNPPDSALATFTRETPPETSGRRDPNAVRPVYYSPRIYTPFTNLHKQQIAELYKQEDLLDTLYPLTRSCENPELKEGHCGDCWWCQERKWGFGYL